jgi:hypothetical protein
VDQKGYGSGDCNEGDGAWLLCSTAWACDATVPSSTCPLRVNRAAIQMRFTSLTHRAVAARTCGRPPTYFGSIPAARGAGKKLWLAGFDVELPLIKRRISWRFVWEARLAGLCTVGA